MIFKLGLKGIVFILLTSLTRQQANSVYTLLRALWAGKSLSLLFLPAFLKGKEHEVR